MADYRHRRVGYDGYMVTRIGPKIPVRHFLEEWREHKRLTQQQLADRLPMGEDGRATGKDQISRWERNERGMTMEVQAALAEALSIEPYDLFRDPAQPSADELLRRATPDQRRQALVVIEALLRTGTGGRFEIVAQEGYDGGDAAPVAAGGAPRKEAPPKT